jgi:adenylate cyclase
VGQSNKNGSCKIKQYAIAVEGLGYHKQFDPSTNPTVRILAQRLRRALDKYYAGAGSSDPIRISIPKGAYVPVISWNLAAIQNTESTHKHTTPDTSRKQTQIPLPDYPSIVVLPLEYLGTKSEHMYIASGITEEIVIALTRFPEFKVVGPLYRDILNQKHLEPVQIGQDYKVRFVLDGTVRYRDRSIRITVKLTDTVIGHQLWGQAYDYEFEKSSIKEIDENAVGQVVATIADAYGIIPRALKQESMAQRSDSLSNYEAMLRFYHHFYVLTPDSHTDAYTALQKTIERDPENAMAAGMLGDLIASTYQYGYGDSEALLDQAEKLGRKAVALDPNCQPALFTMALVNFLRFQDRQFLNTAEKCISVNPNHALYCAALGLHLYMANERTHGMEIMNKAMKLNPHHPGWYHLIPYMEAYRQGDFETALIEARQFNIPAFHFDPLIRAAVFGQLGQRNEASQAIDELLTLVPDFHTRGRSLILRFAHLDEHTEMLLDGLNKAGLEVD